MNRTVLLVVSALFLCISTLAYAQETSSLAVPSVYDYLYNVRVGKHVYYMPNNQLEVLGYDFSSKRLWRSDIYAAWKSPILDLTYTHRPEGIYEIDGAMLLTQSHRGDVELKSGYKFNPTATLEWSVMDLHVWKMADLEVPIKDAEGKDLLDKDGKPITEKQTLMVHNRDSIQRIYGGAGLAFEIPVTNALTFKTAGTYRFVNQRGWEGSAGLSWTPGKKVKGEPFVMLGVTAHEAYYSWGQSRNTALVAEIGFTF